MRKLHVVWLVLILFALEQWLYAHRPEKAFPLGAGALMLLVGFEILAQAKVLGARVDLRRKEGVGDTLVYSLGSVIGISLVGAAIAVGGFLFLVVGYLFYVLFK